MSDHRLILGLESRLMNAWPSFDYQVYDGWILRLAGGYTKRANSATPLLPGTALDEALIDHMVSRFVEANVRPTFRLNGLQASDVERSWICAASGKSSPRWCWQAPSTAIARPIPRSGSSPRFPSNGSGRPPVIWWRQGGRCDPDADRVAHPPEGVFCDAVSRRKAGGLGSWRRRAGLCGTLRHRRGARSEGHRPGSPGGQQPDLMGMPGRRAQRLSSGAGRE